MSLDTWFADWNDSFKVNRNVGNYPQKGVGFHFHFAPLIQATCIEVHSPSSVHHERRASKGITLQNGSENSISLDTWFADWNDSFKVNRNVGNYPQKGVGFHFHALAISSNSGDMY
jgi:hypothetical protein